MTALDVYCGKQRAGVLERHDGHLRFAYASEWAEGGRPPLSQALPVREPLVGAAVEAFFAGLLPEGTPRRRLARRLGVSEGNTFGLLAAIGGDCPGAISLVPSGSAQPTEEQGGDVRWLEAQDLAELVVTLPERPMLAGEDGEVRLSLAGAQDKLPVVVDDAGRVGITSGRTPSTHILKTPIAPFAGTIVNEAFCLALGRALEIRTVTAVPHRVGEVEYLLVERYDRVLADGRIERLHQEDFCQALGVPPELKYEAEGGPSLADCFELVRGAATAFASDLQRMLEVFALSFLVGNHDAHAKNLSLLYRPEGTVELAPFYDILSTVVYPGLARKMAMKLGGEYRPDYVRPRHLDRMLVAAALGRAPARRRLGGLARRAPGAAHAVRADFAAQGWDHAILDDVLGVVRARARQLAEIAAP